MGCSDTVAAEGSSGRRAESGERGAESGERAISAAPELPNRSKRAAWCERGGPGLRGDPPPSNGRERGKIRIRRTRVRRLPVARRRHTQTHWLLLLHVRAKPSGCGGGRPRRRPERFEEIGGCGSPGGRHCWAAPGCGHRRGLHPCGRRASQCGRRHQPGWRRAKMDLLE